MGRGGLLAASFLRPLPPVAPEQGQALGDGYRYGPPGMSPGSPPPACRLSSGAAKAAGCNGASASERGSCACSNWSLRGSRPSGCSQEGHGPRGGANMAGTTGATTHGRQPPGASGLRLVPRANLPLAESKCTWQRTVHTVMKSRNVAAARAKSELLTT